MRSTLKEMKLIIIQGGGASGKTTLAKQLGKSLQIPISSKDEYKQSQRSITKKLSVFKWPELDRRSYRAVYAAIESAVKNDNSLIVEGNFTLSHKKQFQLVAKDCPNVIEIICRSRGFSAVKRYIARNKQDGQPDGYKEFLRYGIVILEAICSSIGIGWYKSLELGGDIIYLDTTHVEDIDYNEVIDFIRSIDRTSQ